jgi:hypothetical protein
MEQQFFLAGMAFNSDIKRIPEDSTNAKLQKANNEDDLQNIIFHSDSYLFPIKIKQLCACDDDLILWFFDYTFSTPDEVNSRYIRIELEGCEWTPENLLSYINSAIREKTQNVPYLGIFTEANGDAWLVPVTQYDMTIMEHLKYCGVVDNVAVNCTPIPRITNPYRFILDEENNSYASELKGGLHSFSVCDLVLNRKSKNSYCQREGNNIYIKDGSTGKVHMYTCEGNLDTYIAEYHSRKQEMDEYEKQLREKSKEDYSFRLNKLKLANEAKLRKGIADMGEDKKYYDGIIASVDESLSKVNIKSVELINMFTFKVNGETVSFKDIVCDKKYSSYVHIVESYICEVVIRTKSKYYYYNFTDKVKKVQDYVNLIATL